MQWTETSRSGSVFPVIWPGGNRAPRQSCALSVCKALCKKTCTLCPAGHRVIPFHCMRHRRLLIPEKSKIFLLDSTPRLRIFSRSKQKNARCRANGFSALVCAAFSFMIAQTVALQKIPQTTPMKNRWFSIKAEINGSFFQKGLANCKFLRYTIRAV